MSKLKTNLTQLPTDELATRAAAALSEQSYKEAIESYKHLLKRETRAEWQHHLQSAYLGRAEGLAGKGMYKEATMLWENMNAVDGKIKEPALYIDWLIRAGQYAKAGRAFLSFQEELTANGTRESVETTLALTLLVRPQELLQVLPADTPLLRQRDVAVAALKAYCEGAEAAQVKAHLKEISFRSPYREFRQLLNALLKWESDPPAAPAALAQLPSHSPYARLAETLLACVSDTLPALAELSPVQRELATSLLGWDKHQQQLLKHWENVQKLGTDKARFNFIAANLAAFDRTQAQQTCAALLVGYPAGLKAYQRLFEPLPAWEQERLRALQAEHDDDLFDAVDAWRYCAHLLTEDRSQPDNPLRAALILRHAANELATQDFDLDPSNTALECLEQSLDLDPDDKASYLRLAKLYKERDNIKKAHYWVEQAAQRFPQDPPILLAAMAAATERKAFKKAVNLAMRLLDLDPVNTKARTVVVESHLAHARKLAKSGKFPQAEKEIDAAASKERVGAHSGVVEIHRGLLAFQQNQLDQTRQWLQESLRQAGGNHLLTQLRLAMESSRFGIRFKAVASSLPSGEPANQAAMLAVLNQIRAYREQDGKGLSTALQTLQPALQSAAESFTGEQDWLSACECYYQVPHYGLLEHCATLAIKREGEKPLFVYYQIYGRVAGQAFKVSDPEFDRLENAADQAKAQQDNRAIALLGKFLSEAAAPPLFNLPSAPPGTGNLIESLQKMLENITPDQQAELLDRLYDEMEGGEPPDLFPPLLPDFPDFPEPRKPKRRRKKNRRR